MHPRLRRQALDLRGAIAVMIAERPRKHRGEAKGSQCSPKTGRVCQAAKGGHGHFRRMSRLPGSSEHPVAWLDAGSKDGRGWVERAQSSANTAIFPLWRGPHEDESIGTCQRTQGLAQLTQREDRTPG